MKQTILLLLLWLPAYAYPSQMENSHLDPAQTPKEFSVQARLSTTALTTDELLTIYLRLNYPADYYPKIDAMRTQLVRYGGLEEPPFSLLSVLIHPPILEGPDHISQQIDFTLSPQLTGSHFLTFQKIIFEPKDIGKNRPVKLLSDLFEIAVGPSTISLAPTSLIAPLMPLSQQLPVTISALNRQKLIPSTSLVAETKTHNLELLNSKTPPWQTIISGLAVLLAWLLIKLQPIAATPKSQQVNGQDNKLLRANLLEQIDQLAISHLIESGKHKEYFITLDHIVRTSINAAYRIEATACTTPELVDKIVNCTLIEQNTRLKWIHLLKKNDQVKFAQYHPTSIECAESAQIAKELLGV